MNPRHPTRDPIFDLLCARCDFNSIVAEAVVVALEDSRPLSASTLAERLGEALQFAGAGELHDTLEHQGVYYVVFDCEALDTALTVLKAELEQRGLLEAARIFSAFVGQQVFEIHWPARLKAQQIQQRLDAVETAIPLAFRQNWDPEWFARFTKLRVDVLLVQFVRTDGGEIFQHPDIQEALGLELQKADAGVYDSSHYANGNQLHVFHVSDLGKALSTLKRQLEIRGLLPLSYILHRETPSAWRCYWSPVAGEIAQLVEDDE